MIYFESNCNLKMINLETNKLSDIVSQKSIESLEIDNFNETVFCSNINIHKLPNDVNRIVFYSLNKFSYTNAHAGMILPRESAKGGYYTLFIIDLKDKKINIISRSNISPQIELSPYDNNFIYKEEGFNKLDSDENYYRYIHSTSKICFSNGGCLNIPDNL